MFWYNVDLFVVSIAKYTCQVTSTYIYIKKLYLI